jgi:hypothetical protein
MDTTEPNERRSPFLSHRASNEKTVEGRRGGKRALPINEKGHEFDMNKPPMSREEFQRLPHNVRLASKVMARGRKRKDARADLQTTPQTGSATAATSHGPSTTEVTNFD